MALVGPPPLVNQNGGQLILGGLTLLEGSGHQRSQIQGQREGDLVTHFYFVIQLHSLMSVLAEVFWRHPNICAEMSTSLLAFRPIGRYLGQ